MLFQKDIYDPGQFLDHNIAHDHGWSFNSAFGPESGWLGQMEQSKLL